MKKDDNTRFTRVYFYDPGGLFNLAVRLMQLFSSSDQNFTELTRCDLIKRQLCQTHLFFRLLGLYFQIRDDYANLRLASYAVNKSFAEDLTEGLNQTSIYDTGLK